VTLGPLGVGVVAASFAASAGAAFLLRYLYRQRGKSGASWFTGNVASVAVFCLAYGIALLVFDPRYGSRSPPSRSWVPTCSRRTRRRSG